MRQPFDRKRRPHRPNRLLTTLIFLMSWARMFWRGLKITRDDMADLSKPSLILSHHQSVDDYFVAFRVLYPHRTNFVSDLEGFIGLEGVCRRIGLLCKRKFTNDLSLVRNIRRVIREHGDSIVIYPEARYCNVGTGCALPDSVGKLAKLLGAPVIVLQIHGNYLNSPIWNLKKRRVRPHAHLMQLLSAEEVRLLSVAEINKGIKDAFSYDEYRWQKENEIRIKEPFRAQSLHKALYVCAHCQSEYTMDTKEHLLFCKHCGAAWEMTELGELRAANGETQFSHIPDWYEFQRSLAEQEVSAGTYGITLPALVDALHDSRGMVPLGMGELRHGMDGFHLFFREDGKERHLHIPPQEMFSLHNEYDYKGKGMGLSLSTLNHTYFIYPQGQDWNVTKMMFATEALYQKSKQEKSVQS